MLDIVMAMGIVMNMAMGMVMDTATVMVMLDIVDIMLVIINFECNICVGLTV